jgi:hypothetical protein
MRLLLCAGAGGLIVGNAVVSIGAAAILKELPTVYREADVRRALAATGTGAGPVVILANDVTASFWDLMANSLNAPRLLLDPKQAEVVYQSHHVVPTELTVVPAGNGNTSAAQPEELYTGKIILPMVAAYSPQPLPFDPRAVLEATAPGLRLIEGNTLFQTTAFRVINGTLVSTNDSNAATDAGKNQPPSIVGVEPRVGRGSNVSFTFTYSDPNGFADLAAALIVINSDWGFTNACYMSYGRLANQLGLARDAGAAWDVTQPGSSKGLEASQCAIDAAHSSTTAAGNVLTLHLTVRFAPGFAGHKKVYSMVTDEGHLTTGWLPVGFWDVP